MADDKRHDAGAVAMAISVPTAIALALSFLKGQKVEAGEPGDYVFPEEVIQLLIAMAATSDETKDAVLAILARLAENGGGEVGQGWPPNVPYIRSTAITCVVVGTAYQAPAMPVPSGMALVVKSYPTNAVGSIIQVATTPGDCSNPNSSYPLIPNEAVSYHIRNAQVLYVSATVAGSTVIFSTEQEV